MNKKISMGEELVIDVPHFHPILFSTMMVNSIIADRKTKTRRVINPQPLEDPESGHVFDGHHKELFDIHNWKPGFISKFCPVSIGTVLWVRETHLLLEVKDCEGRKTRDYYKAEHHPSNDEWLRECGYKWRPAIFMPRYACRLFLEVIDIGIERVQNITESDAKSEGVQPMPGGSFRDYMDTQFGFRFASHSFQSLWKSINGKTSWDANPWVWVYTFKKLSQRPSNFLTLPNS